MRIPIATYRIQFTPRFGFRQAREILDDLSLLGISDLYASPIFQARSGSEHGYDIVAFARNIGSVFMITVAPRFLTTLVPEGTMPLGPQVWGDTALILADHAPSVWHDLISDSVIENGKRLPIGHILKQFPVLLLRGEARA